MRVEEYLNQARRLDNRIHAKMRELETMRETVADIHVPAMGERVQTSRNLDPPFIRALEKIEEVQEKMEAEVRLLVALKVQINEVINTLKNPDEQSVLRYRYIHGMTWNDIALEMNIGEKTARRWNVNALNHIALPTDVITI